MEKIYKTEQEEFWAGEFGTEYLKRNIGPELLALNLDFFSRALRVTRKIGSVLEFGANVGLNLEAIKLLRPPASVKGIEINQDAAKQLTTAIGAENVFAGSILDFDPYRHLGAEGPADLALIKTVLIHINPEMLPQVYEKLYISSKKYVLICEYYNIKPVSVEYRGHQNRLFKRDFAGEMMDLYPDLQLLDYGFAYHRDNKLADDISWFLLEK